MRRAVLATMVTSALFGGSPQFVAGAVASGALLPAGYLSTSGSQIVDQNGNNVRLACVGYDQPGTDIEGDIKRMISAGFNCLRYPWYNATLRSKNLPQMKNIVSSAAKLGMKVIFDHHGDETPSAANDYLPYPRNGIPFDSGPGSDGTDGSGDTGTVTIESFMNDWKYVAAQFANNSTVIAFDLTSEPHLNPNSPVQPNPKIATKSYWGSTWGDLGTTDLVQIYRNAGNMIHAKNPGVLIICEGVNNNTQTMVNGNPVMIHGFPDLTGVAKHPVVLTHSNKVVYSIHDYPTTIGGTMPDGQSSKISAMNVSWGYIVTQRIAPVWIGEMGASLDMIGGDVVGRTPLSSDPARNLADEQTWAHWMYDYLNGSLGSYGGPTFRTCEVGIGTDWWKWGNFDDQRPDGTLSQDGTPRPGQKAITDQLVYKPVQKCAS